MTPKQIRKATTPELRKQMAEHYITLTPSQWKWDRRVGGIESELRRKGLA